MTYPINQLAMHVQATGRQASSMIRQYVSRHPYICALAALVTIGGSILLSKQSQPELPSETLTPKTRVIVAAGPANDEWDSAENDKIRESLQKDPTVTGVILGDTKQDLSIDSIINEIRKAKIERLAITVFVNAHGEISGQGHNTFFSAKESTPTIELFHRIKQELGDQYPFSIFTTACHGNAAAKAAAASLPKGSTFVALSEKPVPVTNIRDFLNQIKEHPCWSSSEAMLHLYLLNTQLGYYKYPVIAHAPNTPLDLRGILEQQAGRPFTEHQKTAIRAHFSHLLDAPRIEHILQQIESGKTDSAVNYGTFMAFCLIAKQAVDTQ